MQALDQPLNENAPQVPAGDYIAEPDAAMYYLSIDPRGELAFEANTSGYGGVPAHLIEVLTDAATNAYRDFLRCKHLSYIVAGERQVDYRLMLAKFHDLASNA